MQNRPYLCRVAYVAKASVPICHNKLVCLKKLFSYSVELVLESTNAYGYLISWHSKLVCLTLTNRSTLTKKNN
jgi:hypothetical protein